MVCYSYIIIQSCITYRSTLSMASGSGGGIWKQTPGKVFVFPSAEMTSQFSMSELDFRVNFSPLTRVAYMITTKTTHAQRFRQETSGCMNYILAASLPYNNLKLRRSTLSVSQSHRDSTVMGLLGLLRRSFRGAMVVLRLLRSASSCSLFCTAFSSAWWETDPEEKTV